MSSCLTVAGGCGSLLQPPAASRFYGVKGGGGVRPEGVVSLSLPSGRAPPSPVQPAPPTPGLVASPYQSVGGEAGGDPSPRMDESKTPPLTPSRPALAGSPASANPPVSAGTSSPAGPSAPADYNSATRRPSTEAGSHLHRPSAANSRPTPALLRPCRPSRRRAMHLHHES